MDMNKRDVDRKEMAGKEGEPDDYAPASDPEPDGLPDNFKQAASRGVLTPAVRRK